MKVKDLIKNSLRNLKPYSSARDEYTGAEGVFLDANENPFGDLNRYPDPYQRELKKALSEIKNVEPNEIFIGNGSDEVIDLAFRLFCNPDEKVATFGPTYGMYKVSSEINSIELLTFDLDADFEIKDADIDLIVKDDKIKMVFICYPNNPTGNCFSLSSIERLLNEFNGLVMIDEAYIDFANESSFSKRINEFDNLIVSQTFSKARGLAAARVGIAFAQESIIEWFNKIKPPYNVSKLNQEAALNALSNKSKYEEELAIIIEGKEQLKKALGTYSFVRKIYPSQANFLLIEVEDANDLYEYLIGQKVIIRNRNNVVRNCVRISIGSQEENLELMEALNKFSK